jgi:hypothetical protein
VAKRFNPADFKYTGSKKRTGRAEPEGYVYHGSTPFSFTRADGKEVTIEPDERLSNRQYQNLRYQASGWKSKSQYETIRHYMHRRHPSDDLMKKGYPHEAGAYKRFGIEYAAQNHVPLNSVYNPTSDYSQMFADALANDFGPDTDGPFSKLLTAIGYRNQSDTWQVGETP